MASSGLLRRSLRRLRAKEDSAKQRWIAIAGGGLALAVIALWATYVVGTMPALLPDSDNVAPSLMDTSASVRQNDDTGGDMFTRSLRGLRDGFSTRWERTRDLMDSIWNDAERSFEAIDQAPSAIPTL